MSNNIPKIKDQLKVSRENEEREQVFRPALRYSHLLKDSQFFGYSSSAYHNLDYICRFR